MPRRLAALLVLLPLCGCSTLGYYGQAIAGHLDIMARREPVAQILADPGADPGLKARLRRAQAYRDFASRVLALPENASYRSYVALDRPYVVWSVFATEEFSLTPRRWCFPVAGCVAYRGWFDEAAARADAARLAAQGLDVYVGGTTAYSTLGWFDDPLISPMFRRGDLGLAGLIFHELAHQQLYVRDDTAFNEAFASTVEEAGLRLWLQVHEPERLAAFERRLERRDAFLDLVASTRRRLEALYAEPGLSVERRRARKAQILEDLHRRYQTLRRRWGGDFGYDAWFEQPVNNARLAAVAVYRERVPDFRRWLVACGGDFARFYAAMARLGALERARREARLRGPAVCP